MKPLRILLILPADRSYFYRGFFTPAISYAPLTLTTLAALVPKEIAAHIDLLDEGVENPCRFDKNRYDIVGITSTASAAPRAYALAKRWREKGAYIAMGGAHITLQPDEAARFAQSVFIGFAEKTWPLFLYDFLEGAPQARYEHPKSTGFLSMPIPRRELLPHGAYMRIPTIIANRGCRMNCEFCSIQEQWGGEGTARPIGEVIEEAKHLQKMGAKRLIFLDPNMCSSRAYTIELLSAFKTLHLPWSGLATVDLADDEKLLQLFEESRCEGLLLGLENLNPETMRQINKPFNKTADYRRQLKRLHQAKIATLGCFVLGFDHDTEEGIRRLIEEIPSLPLDLVRFAILTPHPGGSLHTRLKREGRILSNDLSFYDSHHAVFHPKNMSPEKLETLFFDAWEKTYRAKAIFHRVIQQANQPFLKLASNVGFHFYARKMRQNKDHIT